MSSISKVTRSVVNLPCQKPTCSCGSNGLMIGWTQVQISRAYYGVEWKERICMEWLKYGMEDWMYGMKKSSIFHTCTFCHGVAEVQFFFQLNIAAN